MQDPNKLNVYTDSFALANDVTTWIRASKVKYELPRLADQLFGSVTSVPANLKEFCAFDSKGQKKQKLAMCIGETLETDMWLELANKQQLMADAEYKDFAARNESVRKRLFGLKNAVETAA
jgi:four helix bundle protein